MTDTTKYDKCPECKEYAVHLYTSTLVFYGDSDDNNGDPSEYDDDEIVDEIGASVYAHICAKCQHMVDIGIEHPQGLDANVARMRAAIERELPLLDGLADNNYSEFPHILWGIIERLKRSLK